MAFQADQKVKSEILTKLGTDQLFCLLRDAFIDIVMKTLGLLRNLLAHKPHIDRIMLQSGEQVRLTTMSRSKVICITYMYITLYSKSIHQHLSSPFSLLVVANFKTS